VLCFPLRVQSEPERCPEGSRPFNEYCGLFSYRWEWINAPIPDLENAKPQISKSNKAKPEWQTHQHPLPDCEIQSALSGECLIGVSFAATTNYLLADLDRWSSYHPHCNVIEFHRLLACLEEVGLVRPLIVQSSRSEGLHVYYPLPISVSSYYLSKTAQHALESAGFKLSSGQLELFPNAKRYDPDGKTSFRAHRLPLLTGSYLLHPQTLEPYSNSLSDFLSAWNLCSKNQDSDQLTASIAETKERERAYRRSRYQRGRSRSKEGSNLYDLSHLRWSGGGQTNDLLGHATWIGCAVEGLRTEESLLEWVVEWARNSPGYEEFCDHKHEIERRCRDWSRSILSRSYKPPRRRKEEMDGEKQAKPPMQAPGLNNTERIASARSRIQRAMAELIQTNSLPAGVEARLLALQKLVGGSHGTYYRNRELWHPVDLAAAAEESGSEEEAGSESDGENVPNTEENPLDIVGSKRMQSRLTDGVYEVMGRWKGDENPERRSTLIPQLRPQLAPQIGTLIPQWRVENDWRPPMLWPKWGEMVIPPRLLSGADCCCSEATQSHLVQFCTRRLKRNASREDASEAARSNRSKTPVSLMAVIVSRTSSRTSKATTACWQ
jgi:hypothetical protein